MAHMRPPDPSFEQSPTSEQDVFQALQQQLSDEYTVFYSLDYLSRDKRLPGEVDFLITHPSDGLLFVECKGGGVYVDNEQRWFRTSPDGSRHRMRTSPVEQVQTQMYDIMGLIKDGIDQLQSQRPISTPTYGYAVLFPYVDDAETLARLELPSELIFDSDEMRQLPKAVKRAMGFWNQKHGKARITQRQFCTIVDRVISPSVNVVPDLNDALEVERRAFRRLDVQQSFAVEVLIRNRRMAVEGKAGTGKTMIALEAARRMRDQGKRVLLTCFNSALAAYLRTEISKLDVDSAIDKELEGHPVEVSHFHELCHRSAQLLNQPFEPPSRDASKEKQQDFWQHQAAEFLELAAIDSLLGTWDAIIVDEYQDFDSSWLTGIRGLLEDTATSSLALLYDPAQAIFDQDFTPPSPLEFPVVPLPANYRNTQEIAKYLKNSLHHGSNPHPSAPTGVPPEIHQQHSPKQTRKEVAALVRNLTGEGEISPESITILTPHRSKSFIGDRGSIEGIPYATDPTQRDGKILWMTLSSFKGLESDVVILADIDANDPRSGPEELYVAASRARHRLFIWEKP